MVYDVPISLTGADKLPLLVGMTANVQIQVGQVDDALLVPSMALQPVNGTYQVARRRPRRPQRRPPEPSRSRSASPTAPTPRSPRGLNAGDQVVVQMSTGTANNNFGFPGGPAWQLRECSKQFPAGG